MIDRYRQHHWEAINQYCPSIYNQNSTDPNNPNLYTPADPNNAVRVDARSAWFSLETLKAFINTIETRTCANTAPNCMPALGVRIYYAEYPTDATELQTYAPENGTIDPTYAGMHTLLMIPTYDAGANHIDFDPDQMVAGNPCPATSIFDSGSAMISGSITALAAQNHGGLAPPPFYYGGGMSTGQGYWNGGAYFMRYVDVFKRSGPGSIPNNTQPAIGR